MENATLSACQTACVNAGNSNYQNEYGDLKPYLENYKVRDDDCTMDGLSSTFVFPIVPGG
jgi:hypothetical protein